MWGLTHLQGLWLACPSLEARYSQTRCQVGSICLLRECFRKPGPQIPPRAKETGTVGGGTSPAGEPVPSGVRGPALCPQLVDQCLVLEWE